MAEARLSERDNWRLERDQVRGLHCFFHSICQVCLDTLFDCI